MRRPLSDRLYEKTEWEPNTGCLLWSGSVNHKGYGLICITKGYNRSTHRVSWELANDCLIPSGMHVLHKCDTPACINPDHLRLGTNRENRIDAIKKGRIAVGSARLKPSNTKLTADNVRDMRASVNETMSVLASRYGVSKSLVFNVLRKKAWPEAEISQ